MLALRSIVLLAAIALLASLDPSSAHAQRGGGWGRMFQLPAVTLAQLDVVQEDLQLSEEQKKQVTELNEKLNEERRDLFQGGPAADREQFMEKWAKFNADAADAFNEILDDAQEKRAQEIYIQVNGPSLLVQEAIAEPLKISDEQQEKLQDVLAASREEFMNAGLRDMEREEAAKKMAELIASRDEKLLAVLNDDQRTQFEKMQGKKIEIDLSELPRPGRS
jgi:hypothetical protein